MPPYHSQITDDQIQGKVIGNTPLLPLKNINKKSPTRTVPEPSNKSEPDIVDETLDLFKANVFFTTYEVREKSDRILIYSTLYVILCLKKLARCPNRAQAEKDMFALALQNFDLPGEAGFPLNPFFEKPKDNEKEELRKYLSQLRQELGYRLIDRVFDAGLTGGEDKPSKWWTCFAKKKFLNVALSK